MMIYYLRWYRNLNNGVMKNARGLERRGTHKTKEVLMMRRARESGERGETMARAERARETKTKEHSTRTTVSRGGNKAGPGRTSSLIVVTPLIELIHGLVTHRCQTGSL